MFFRGTFLPPLRADLEAFANYRLEPGRPISGPLFAFGGTEDDSVSEVDLRGWSEHTVDAFEWAMLSGDHFFVHDPQSEFLERLAVILDTLAQR